jgi:hypothetical protein
MVSGVHFHAAVSGGLGFAAGGGILPYVTVRGNRFVVDTLADIEQHLSDVLVRAERSDVPFRHWTLGEVLPPPLAEAFETVALPVPDVGAGTRAAANNQRHFLSLNNRFGFPFCADVAAAFQSPTLTAGLSEMCGIDLDGSYLRIEFCQDQDGFWLEPHTDIGAKLFTGHVSLSRHPGTERMGTDFLDTEHNLVVRMSGAFNSGYIFIPGADTWHAFAPRKIEGLRRSLIINYVKPEWRSRHELAFPDDPVRTERPGRLAGWLKRLRC